MPETHHPQSGVVPSVSASGRAFHRIIDQFEKLPVPVNGERILVRYVEHLRYVVDNEDASMEEMRDCIKHVLSIFPRVAAFRLLPQLFAAIVTYRQGDLDKAADVLLCVQCALDLARAA